MQFHPPSSTNLVGGVVHSAAEAAALLADAAFFRTAGENKKKVGKKTK